MARPPKKGLDYFPHDTVPDKKLLRFYRLFKAQGKAFWWTMLEEIYQEGFFIDVSDAETRLLLADACFCTPEEWDIMLARALKEGLFDADRYADEKILTSQAIFKRFESVAQKRKQNANYYANRKSAAETPAETQSSAGFHFAREIRSDQIRSESPISPFSQLGEAPEGGVCPTAVDSVYEAYPRIRFKKGKAFPVRLDPVEDRSRIAEFLASRPDYPLLEAVRLLKETAELPRDLRNFLAAPDDIRALREAAAANGRGQKEKSERDVLSVLEQALKKQEQDAQDFTPVQMEEIRRQTERKLGIKLSPSLWGGIEEDET